MRLRDLLIYNEVVIQCHDNPDADALASGYALYKFFEMQGRNVEFIYRGRNKIRKSNLRIMVDELDIPIHYASEYGDNPELLITVDCQYGQKNVTETKAQNIAVIDHHQVTTTLPDHSEVRSSIGSASTVVWDMIWEYFEKEQLKDTGKTFFSDIKLATALYYGLYTDTNKLAEVSHPLDRDMIDDLVINKSLIVTMCNSNISLDELKITGKAILGYDYHVENRYLMIKAEPCDPNILGVMSDFSLETEGVDICLAYYETEQEIKFSVRSCIKEVHANELASYLADGIGGGGGHIYKAGGSIRPEKMYDMINSLGDQYVSNADEFIKRRMDSYFDSFDVIYAKESMIDTKTMLKYRKLQYKCGCVRMTDLFPSGTTILIRALEGDIEVAVQDDIYLMIGIEGEVYPIARDKLEASYEFISDSFDAQYEYAPTVKNVSTSEKKSVTEYAWAVRPKSSSCIYAKELDRTVKVFTLWDDDKYYLGLPGDYLACREDDTHDVYIVKEKVFNQIYEVLD